MPGPSSAQRRRGVGWQHANARKEPARCYVWAPAAARVPSHRSCGRWSHEIEAFLRGPATAARRTPHLQSGTSRAWHQRLCSVLACSAAQAISPHPRPQRACSVSGQYKCCFVFVHRLPFESISCQLCLFEAKSNHCGENDYSFGSCVFGFI